MSRNDPKEIANRLISVDALRVVAMLMVIALHTILNFTQRIDFFATKLWFLLEPFVALSKTSVLLFFMLSGYLVISKNRTLSENWQKTKKRILIPLLVFSLINLILEFTKFNFTENVASVFWHNQLVRITSFPSSPLWFLVVLLFLYLLNPVWQVLFAVERKSDLALYVTGLALAFSILGAIIKFPSLKNGIIFNNFTSWTGYLFFYLYGGLIRNRWLDIHRRRLNLALVFGGLIVTMIGDYYTLFAQLHEINFIWTGYFFEYLSIPVTCMAIGLFNLIISADFPVLRKDQWASNTMMWLAGLSFGVYLVHTIVVALFSRFGFDFNTLSINVYVYNALNYTLVLGISIAVTYLLKKTSFLRWTIGE